MRCYLNIPVIGRESKDIEFSVIQMLEVAKARWGVDTEVAIPRTKEGPRDFLNNEEPNIYYICQCLEVLEECDCAIVILDNYFCKDAKAMSVIDHVIQQITGMPVVALHCSDWFPDAIQSMNDVPVN